MYPILMKWCVYVFTDSSSIFKFKFDVTAFRYSSTEHSGSVPVNTISGLFDVIDDPPIRYGFILICSNSAACGICEKFVSWLLVICCCY